MEARAVARFVRVPPRKARLVVDMIRGKDVTTALAAVRFVPKAAAREVAKVLHSALANAQNNHGVREAGRLVVHQAFVDQGPVVKRIRPRAMGRAFRIRKRTSHITIILREREA